MKIVNVNGSRIAMVRTSKFGNIRVKFVSCNPNFYYRIFKTSRGTFVARESMENPENWTFVSSVKLPRDLSQVAWE